MSKPSLPGGSRHNAILVGLPDNERELVTRSLERVSLPFKQVLQDIGEPIAHLWFPESGVVSVVTEMENGDIVEVATVGHEGVAGLSEILGSSSSAHRTIVQIAGEGCRLPVEDYRVMRDRLPRFQALVLRYTLSMVTQISQGSACNRLHPLEARCARWLLQTHDRVPGDDFELTHEFLAQMLGVTRPSVSLAAGILQKAGLITYVRGVVTVLDREGLEDAACECYGIIAGEYQRLIGSNSA